MPIFTFNLIVSITIIPKKAILQCMGINMMFYNQYLIYLKYLFAGFQVARVGGATIAGTAVGTARRAT